MAISFQQASIGSKTFHDYLSGALSPEFYAFRPDMDGLKKAIDTRKNFPVNRNLLVTALHNQYKNTKLTKAVKQNLKLLESETTYTVTTGHQLCVYTGPLYFIYKIISVVSLSRQLKAACPEHDFVPVYWMNSEDHDFAEINHFYLFGRRLEWIPSQPAGGPVGRMKTDGLAELVDMIHRYFPNLRGYDEVLDIFYRAYTTHADLASATREIVHTLFGGLGLVILDQDDAQLKTAVYTVIADDLETCTTHRLVTETIQKLEKHHYSAQVSPREVNLFYQGGPERVRVVKEKDHYGTADGKKHWSYTELTDEWKHYPENFSTNVVTRPLYQESVLPNIAYIGGPAEVHYWLQYRSVFDAYNIFFPCLVMRDSFLLMPEKKQKQAAELGLSLSDLMADEHVVINRYLQHAVTVDTGMEQEQQVVKNMFSTIRERMKNLDPTLEKTANAEEQRMLNSLHKMEGKMHKALRRMHDDQIKRIQAVRSVIYPGGSFQERHDSFLTHTADITLFTAQLVAMADPLQAEVKLLTT